MPKSYRISERAFVLTGCLALSQSLGAQGVPAVGATTAWTVAPGRADSLVLPLKDGDYIHGVVNRQARVGMVVLNPDGSVHGRLQAGAVGSAKQQFTFAADAGSGRYQFVVTNASSQPVSVEVLIDKIQSLDDRLGPTRSAWDSVKSPRIEALRAEIGAGHTNTDAFWKEVADKGTPLVERFDSAGAYQLVTFLWRAAHDTRNVMVIGSFRDPVSQDEMAMHQIGSSDVWYWTTKLPAGSRFDYTLSPNDPITWNGPRSDERDATRQVDPLNPHREALGSRTCPATASKYACISIAELPGAPPQPWRVAKPGTPLGTVQHDSIRSAIQGIERPFYVYTPANYRADGPPNSLLVLSDGGAYLPGTDPKGWYDPQGWLLLTTMNELIAAAKIPPTIVVFIENVGGRRTRDLMGDPGFTDFAAKELVPWMHAHYNVTKDPARTATGGYSAGGLAAAYMGLRHPEVFGNVISLSGSFWWSPSHNSGYCGQLCQDSGFVAISDLDATTEPNWMAKQFIGSPKLPVRFYLSAGTFETDRFGRGGEILETTRTLRDVLLAKGYDAHYEQVNSGHDGLNWRGTIANALIYLLGSR